MKQSFRDPATGVLKSWGYVASSAGGDLARDELDEFNLDPGKWQLVNDAWAPFDPVLIPQSVTMRQARLALMQSSLLAQVDVIIAAMTSPQKEAAQIEWQYSSEVHRHKALVLSLGPALGLNDAQLDQLFITAATL